ncbi:MAG: hypothetical protein K5931_10695 [Lachnospiraceae bacterium]|nr:hypothetical protein [Lachnospiraceae bacterium]
MPGKKYVIGYDLNDTVTQISYVELNKEAPLSLAQEGEERKLGIPTVLCKRGGVNQWYYGTDAQREGAKGNGVIASKFLGVARAGGKFEIEKEAYDAGDLLVLFVRKTLTQLSGITTPDQVMLLVITVDELDEKTMELLNRVADAMPITRDRICFKTYAETTYQYMIHQPQEIWDREVVIFDYSGKGLHGQHFSINRKTKPKVGFLENFDFEDIMMPDIMLQNPEDPQAVSEFDEDVLERVHDYVTGKSVSTIYLLGDGFDSGYLKKTIKYMCMGRRVFQGKNLYAKGACFYARDKITDSPFMKEFVFLGKGKLKFNFGMKMDIGSNEEYIAVADGGENWFEAGRTIEFLLKESNEITMLITPLNGKKPKNLKMVLEGLPKRPTKTSRIRLKIEFKSESCLRASAWDMGFGDIFASSGLKWEETLDIEDGDKCLI